MRLFLSALIIIAVFSVNKYVFSNKVINGVTTVSDMISVYPVDLFDFKKTMQAYVYHLCYKNEKVLNIHHASASECVSQHDENKLACDKKVFRLAPLNLESEREVLNYAKQYSQCTLPYRYI